MSRAKTQLEIAQTGVAFEQLRADYWKAHNSPERADASHRELQKWQLKYENAWLISTGEKEGEA